MYLASSCARVLTLASAGPGPSSSHFVVFRLVLSRLLFLAQILQVKERASLSNAQSIFLNPYIFFQNGGGISGRRSYQLGNFD